MKIEGIGALVVGGSSGLGAATVEALRERGANVAIADLKPPLDAAELPFFETDVQDEDKVKAAVEGAVDAVGGDLRFVVDCAGVATAERTIGRERPANPVLFEITLGVNLTGMYRVLRHSAWAMSKNEPDQDGNRGAVVMTASIAAYEGQIGQTAYGASKAGIVGLTLPAARDLARIGIRVVTIAPGIFDTPLLAALPQETRDSLAAAVPHPSRLGHPAEFAALAVHIAENQMLNGETIRLDGALRMPPK